MQSRSLSLGQRRLVRLEGVLHLGRGELLDLLGSTADESARVKEGVELAQNGGEELSATDALQQVVVLSVLLDIVGGLVGEDTCVSLVRCSFYLLMGFVTYGFLRGRPGETVPSSRMP